MVEIAMNYICGLLNHSSKRDRDYFGGVLTERIPVALTINILNT